MHNGAGFWVLDLTGKGARVIGPAATEGENIDRKREVKYTCSVHIFS
jgi:hypothetical protein